MTTSEIQKLLLPRELYSVTQKKYGQSPYKFEIQNDKQVLYYFGANHSHDPANHQYQLLYEYWESFLEKTEGKDRIILREGDIQNAPPNKERAILWGGEGALTIILSKDAHVPLASADLSSHRQVELLGDDLKEEVLLQWFLAYTNGWQRHPDPKPDFKKQAEDWFDYQKTRPMWSGINPSLERAEELYQNFTGKKFSETDASINSLIDPNNTGNRINEISRIMSDLRDEHITSEILRYWKEGKSIFVVFGSGHLIIEKPALEALLK